MQCKVLLVGLWLRGDDHVAAVVTEQWERRSSWGPSFLYSALWHTHVFGASYTFQLICHFQNTIVKTVMEALIQENVYGTYM